MLLEAGQAVSQAQGLTRRGEQADKPPAPFATSKPQQSWSTATRCWTMASLGGLQAFRLRGVFLEGLQPDAAIALQRPWLCPQV